MKIAVLALLAVPSVALAQTDGSGTLATAGTSQVVFIANVNRTYLECQNPIAATEALVVNVPGTASTAGGSYELAPGGAIRFTTPGFVPNGPVSVSAATAGHRFVCKQN